MFYKNGVLLDLFLYSTFLAFMKSIVKVFFISLLAQRNETKKCAGSYAAGPLCRIKRQILYMNLQK